MPLTQSYKVNGAWAYRKKMSPKTPSKDGWKPTKEDTKKGQAQKMGPNPKPKTT